jgi:glycosyltransferase involved in cell wall biosynthesis
MKSISVVIPYYNAATFIKRSIESVLIQVEVGELLLINDGSTDKSLEIVKTFNDDRIVSLHHDGNVNKGRSASRNLGLKHATKPFVAFLDADDYYLENRFTNDFKVFKTNINCDGVYNAIGVHFYRKSNQVEQDILSLTSLKEYVESKDLAATLVKGRKGYFHLNGFTLKKNFVDKIGFFNEELDVAEDTEWIWKAAYLGTLIPGNLKEPVALRGVHDTNSFNDEKLYDQAHIKLFHAMYTWSIKQKLSLSTIELFFERIMILEYKKQPSFDAYFALWWKCIKSSYRVLFSYLAVKYFPIIYKFKSIKNHFYN